MSENDQSGSTEPEDQSTDWLTAQLASLADPPMPADVDARMRTVIAQQLGSTSRSRTRWLPIAAAASLLVAFALALSSVLGNSGSAPGPVVMAAGVQPIATNTSYTRDNIESEVRAHLTALRAKQSVGSEVSAQKRLNTFIADPQSIDGCLSALNPRTGEVHLVDLADYQGQPSGIVVFQAADEVQVFVVAPTCNREDPRVRLRLQTSLAAD